MVLELVVPALISFVIVASAVYAGVLRALDVYFDPQKDSVFLGDDHDPRNRP
ncbi:hypothetical protein [Halomarina rubra]|uniref:Uncharacterized protein n=1 Tax=Halomarina rubra TaxID=2071873 RepID=A0ABD6ARL5_9EURY|nr:hypothetical protein [Halomarina rubra]